MNAFASVGKGSEFEAIVPIVVFGFCVSVTLNVHCAMSCGRVLSDYEIRYVNCFRWMEGGLATQF